MDDDKINPRLKEYNLPKEFDFHKYPEDDILAPLYKYENLRKEEPMKIILGRRKDPHIADK